MTQQNSYLPPFAPYQAYNSGNRSYIPSDSLQNAYYSGGGGYSGNPLSLSDNLNYYQQQQQQQLLLMAQQASFRPSPFTAGFQPVNRPHTVPQAQQQVYQPPPTLQQFNDEVIQTEPDEFILDLLRKPQERLFLLKLELQFEAFINDETRLRFDIPNMNSYQRLMVHKLAPYYKLNHYHDAMRKGVYVCKTNLTEMPSVRLQDVQLKDETTGDNYGENTGTSTPNGDGSDTNTSTNTNSRNQSPQFKIMRRETGTNSPRTSLSNVDSGSESVNNDNKPKLDRKNMTYEERQAAYEEARARIFQDLHNKD
ncbi:single-stranded nucleic acid binding R3H [Mycotypha africana]|uniref:single-stranded nucleic acid binding R3H n=1 Tax=Mycotypha africana TaxID=64632 RepID=UPI0023006AFA|nr:single-stranded nucleic acid binding R3H [Mycotypha africana]KAI8968390.1 single-stranded nucleic acid binding R3H [Mycotypha africana]